MSRNRAELSDSILEGVAGGATCADGDGFWYLRRNDSSSYNYTFTDWNAVVGVISKVAKNNPGVSQSILDDKIFAALNETALLTSIEPVSVESVLEANKAKM